MRFRAVISNTAGLAAASARVTAALPAADWRQDLINLSYEGTPETGTDRYGQASARLGSGSIAPGGSVTVGWTTQARLWALKVRVPDSRLVDPATADATLRGHFLSASFPYLAMSSPTVTNFAAAVGVSPANFVNFGRGLRDQVFQALSYNLDSVWDDAATVLQRGSGSCSEYSFVTSAAWRLNGYPTRFVGASTGGSALESGAPDDTYHRWIEIYAPGIGWVPMDCNHNDSGSVTPFSNELVFGVNSRKLIVLKGGCEDGDWLGHGYTWNYNATSGSVDVDGAYEWSWR